MEYTIGQIQEILGADGHIVSPSAAISVLLTDSRKVNTPASALFFAIRGPHHDGHQYMEHAYQQGIRHFIVDRPHAEFPDADILVVDDVVGALQKLAKYHRLQFTYPVIGITGSNGKTVVKEWIYHLLKPTLFAVRSPKSFNSQIGVPLSIWQMEKHHDLAIIEAGISQTGEMQQLEQIIRPSIGVLTHLGPAHDEGFSGDILLKAKEKLALFQHTSLLVYCADTPAKELMATLSCDQVTWSRQGNTQAIWHVMVQELDQQLVLIRLNSQDETYDFKIPFSDEAAIENAINAFLTCLQLDVPVAVLMEQASSLPVVRMRMELIAGMHQSLLINDVYSADPGSLDMALHYLQRQSKQATGNAQEKCVIISDMDGSGLSSDKLYQQIAQQIRSADVSRLVGIGPELLSHQHLFSGMQTSFFSDAQSFLKEVHTYNWKDAVILVKGARRFHLEQVIEALEWKLHNTELQVNLNHMAHNLHTYRSLVPQGVQVMAMVKAFGYGSGTAEVAQFLAFNRVDYLAVAYTDEGLELRRNGVHLPIMVMNPAPASILPLLQHKLEPEVFSLDQCRQLLEVAGNAPIKVHVKLNTGMNRLGFSGQDIPALGALLRSHPRVDIVSVFSHLSSADMMEEDAFSREQIARFEEMSLAIANETGQQFLRHVLNSPGIARFPDACFDMIRLGIGLYGDDPSEEIQSRLLPVSTLITTVAQVHDLQAGESIGYGRSFRTKAAMRLAVLNIGYADGFRRSLGNGVGQVWLHGKWATVVGRVCMDMCMVDVTDIPEAKPGSVAEVFGEHQSLRSIAEAMDTIPYEVLTGISQRVRRTYLEE